MTVKLSITRAATQTQTSASTPSPEVTSTTATLPEEELKWGETARAEGGSVTVSRPIVDSVAKAGVEGIERCRTCT